MKRIFLRTIISTAVMGVTLMGMTAPAAQAAPSGSGMGVSNCKTSTATAVESLVTPANFNPCQIFPGGRVVKPGWSSCPSKYGTWRWEECRKSYIYVQNYVVYKKGTPKPASCV